METRKANAPFGYETELVDGELALKPNDDAVVVKMAFGLFNDLSNVYSKYGLENASSLALKSTTDALNSLPDGNAIHERFQQSQAWQNESAYAMTEQFKQVTK